MRRSNIIYYLDDKPYPSQPTLCKALGITPNSFRIKVFRLGGLDNLKEIKIKDSVVYIEFLD